MVYQIALFLVFRPALQYLQELGSAKLGVVFRSEV
jgi:hypothetical protein